MKFEIEISPVFIGAYIIVVMYIWWCLQGGTGFTFYDHNELINDLRPYIYRPYIWTTGK